MSEHALFLTAGIGCGGFVIILVLAMITCYVVRRYKNLKQQSVTLPQLVALRSFMTPQENERAPLNDEQLV
jgi:hypothetical protein